MRTTHRLALAAVTFASLAASLAFVGCEKDSAGTDAARPSLALVASAEGPEHDIAWGPAPDVFPKGAEMAVMAGDPGSTNEFTVRLRFPNGYRIPPHTHPTAENVTVLEGTFLAGMGTTFDESQLQTFKRDGFASIPAEHPHYAMARGQTIVQVHAIGPFALTYVNPADDPRGH